MNYNNYYGDSENNSPTPPTSTPPSFLYQPSSPFAIPLSPATQDDDDVINLDSPGDIDASGKGARSWWSKEDENHLARAWCKTTSDGVVSNEQRGMTYYNRIADELKRTFPSSAGRTGKATKTHWLKIQASLNLFVGCVARIQSAPPISGYNDTMYENEAVNSYKRAHKKPFTYLHVYNLVKDTPKFRNWVTENDKLQRAKRGESINLMDINDQTQPTQGEEVATNPGRALGRRSEEERRRVEKEKHKEAHSQSSKSIESMCNQYSENSNARKMEFERKHERELMRINVEIERNSIDKGRLELKRKILETQESSLKQVMEHKDKVSEAKLLLAKESDYPNPRQWALIQKQQNALYARMEEDDDETQY
ncbi:hypothetical protein ACHQM5_022026 [Ranunculus cassubicifolius]